MMIKLIALFLYILPLSCNAGFFDKNNEHRGFYWFEQKDEEKPYQIPTPEESLSLIESRKIELDDARNQMLATSLDPVSTSEAIRASIINYKNIEAKMWDSAARLSDAFEMANFVTPALNDNLEAPTNVYAVKIKREMDQEANIKLIKEFANKYDFVLFAEDYCKYCHSFVPVFKDFASDFNFKYEISSLSSEAGKIAIKLGITSVPTLIAVKKDGKFAFEVSRGMLSRSSLEENIVLAKKYSDEKATK